MNPMLLSRVRTSGRVTFLHGALYLGFSASFAEFDTDSEEMLLNLVTDLHPLEKTFQGRVQVTVDGKVILDTLLSKPVTPVHFGFPETDGLHRVRITKLSEAAFGLVGIESIWLCPGARLLPTEPETRRIEFVGDSITCGYGVEASASDTFSTATENPLKAYAVLASRALHAEHTLVSWSGIGVITNWVPPEAKEKLHDILMPELYPYHDLRLARRMHLPPEPHAFSRDPVDLTVIYLGTNDQSWTKGLKDREQDFSDSYDRFLQQVAGLRPGTPLLLVLGTMGGQLMPHLEDACRKLRDLCPDTPVQTLHLPLQLPEDGMGADGHPSPVTQEKAARELEKCIRAFMDWQD